MSTLSAKEYKCFEDIKRVRPDGSEYWAARELAPVLDYAKWENFYKVIKRAMIACENSGRSTLECFPEVRKTSPMPNGGVKDILDYELSRYACYLIVQNGDPRKEVIALGQTYFAIQTYRQEVADRFNQLDEDIRELEAADGYILDKQYKTVYVEAGKTSTIEWENTAVTGQIQITKYAAESNAICLLCGGNRLPPHRGGQRTPKLFLRRIWRKDSFGVRRNKGGGAIWTPVEHSASHPTACAGVWLLWRPRTSARQTAPKSI